MTAAYDWAFTTPLRKLHHNAVVTGLAVAVALVIGTLQLVAVAHERFGLRDAVSGWVVGLDTSWAEIAVVVGFAALWGAARLWWSRAGPRAAGA